MEFARMEATLSERHVAMTSRDGWDALAAAKAGACAEGEDRCEVVQTELRKLFAGATSSQQASMPAPRPRPVNATAVPQVQSPTPAPQPRPISASIGGSLRLKPSMLHEPLPEEDKPYVDVSRYLLPPSEHGRLQLEREVRRRCPQKKWNPKEENAELRKQLRRMAGRKGEFDEPSEENVLVPNFDNLSEENRWLREQVTTKLMKALMVGSLPPSASSTRLPSPSNSIASSRRTSK